MSIIKKEASGPGKVARLIKLPHSLLLLSVS